jgi:hypothetical protein
MIRKYDVSEAGSGEGTETDPALQTLCFIGI